MKTNNISTIFLILIVLFSYVFVFPAHYNKAVNYISDKTPITLPKLHERGFMQGLDLQGGAYLLYEADLSEISSPSEKAERMNGLRDIIEKRIDLYGVGEHSVQVRGERLSVEIPGAHDLEDAIEIIGETPFLDFREIPIEVEQEIEEKWEELEGYFGKTRYEIGSEDFAMIEEGDVEGWEVVIESPYRETGLTGEHLDGAGVFIDQISQRPIITLEFNERGTELFSEITARNQGRLIATFLDGEMLQEATVREVITGGEAQISGNFSVEEAYQTARDLRIGALPVPIELVTQQSIGPSLGEDALEMSVRAGLIGFMLVAVFMIAFYKLPGLISVISLSIYVLLVFFLFKYIPITLTLSGIAGFLLSVGMAIDANILIISRMREEIRAGKTIKESIREGYLKAWSSIRDGNFTTFMVAAILFFVTTSFVRGFAITLMVGILVSLFSAMVATWILLNLFEGKTSKFKKLWH